MFSNNITFLASVGVTAEVNPAVTGGFLSQILMTDQSYSPKAHYLSVFLTRWTFESLLSGHFMWTRPLTLVAHSRRLSMSDVFSSTGNTMWHLGAACRRWWWAGFRFDINTTWILTHCRFTVGEKAMKHKPASLGAMWSSTTTSRKFFLTALRVTEAKSVFIYSTLLWQMYC